MHVKGMNTWQKCNKFTNLSNKDEGVWQEMCKYTWYSSQSPSNRETAAFCQTILFLR